MELKLLMSRRVCSSEEAGNTLAGEGWNTCAGGEQNDVSKQGFLHVLLRHLLQQPALQGGHRHHISPLFTDRSKETCATSTLFV